MREVLLITMWMLVPLVGGLRMMSSSSSSDRFMPPAMEARLKKGALTSADLNRAFSPSKRDLDSFARVKYEGVTGVVLSLEGVLVDLTQVFKYAFAILAEDLRREVPSEAAVNDVIGCSFSEALLALQWGIPRESVDAVETRFGIIFNKIVEALPVSSTLGAETLLDELIRGGNTVVINTYLSRENAIKVISKSGLSNTLEGRVTAENLVFPSPEYKVTYRGQQLIRCCGVMKKPTVSSLSYRVINPVS
jgi:hypothetical protein